MSELRMKFIAGPCVIESYELLEEVASVLVKTAKICFNVKNIKGVYCHA